MYSFCKYCGKEKELIKAHIIPKSFYEKQQYFVISTSGDVTDNKIQNGIKDSNILCKECDSILGEYDKYAKEIFFDKLSKYTKYRFLGYNILSISENNFNYNKLRKFFISLVWRTSISNSKYTDNIHLGKYEDIALKILKDEMTDDNTLFYPLIVKRITKHEPCVRTILQGKFDGQWSSDFIFADYRLKIITKIKNNDVIEKLYPNRKDFNIIETDKDVLLFEKNIDHMIQSYKKGTGGGKWI